MTDEKKKGFLSAIWESMTKTGGCCGSGEDCCGSSRKEDKDESAGSKACCEAVSTDEKDAEQ
jgi:hypothetical protein